MGVFLRVTTILIASCVWISAQAAEMNIVQTATSYEDLSTLVSLLKKADLVSKLEEQGPFTLFAPTNEAFAALPKEQLNALIANPEQLRSVLLYHVVGADLSSSKIKPGVFPTAQGQSITITIKDGKIFMNDAEILKADIQASNGVIHAISAVLIPPPQR